MSEKVLKFILLFQFLLIIFLLFKLYSSSEKINLPQEGLLAKRVYAGILPGKSFLITSFYPVERGIKKYIQENNFTVSVYVENLNNGANFEINAEKGFFPASLNKLPVAVLILQKVEQGKLSLHQKIETSNGKEETIQELLEKMLKDSDNESFESLLKLLDPKELKALLDYYNINLDGSYFPDKVKEHEEQLGPKQFANIFSSLYYSTVLDPKDSEYLLSLMKDTEFNFKEISALNPSTTLAHKFAGYYTTDTKLFHDCGIIYDGDIKILYCIMTENLEHEHAIKVTANIINSIFTYAKETRAQLDESSEMGQIYPENKTDSSPLLLNPSLNQKFS